MKEYKYVKDDHGYTIKIEIKKPKTEPSEKDIQDKVAAVFIRDGWEVIRYNSGTFKAVYENFTRWITCNRNANSGATSGHADVICFKDLQAVRIEMKKQGKKRSKAQETYHNEGMKYGNPILVIDSVTDATELISQINKIGIKNAIYSYILKK